MHIPEQLFIRNVWPGERSYERYSQYTRTLDEAAKAGNALIEMFSAEQKEPLEAFMDAQREVSILTAAETFIYSFTLGANGIIIRLTVKRKSHSGQF